MRVPLYYRDGYIGTSSMGGLSPSSYVLYEYHTDQLSLGVPDNPVSTLREENLPHFASHAVLTLYVDFVCISIM